MWRKVDREFDAAAGRYAYVRVKGRVQYRMYYEEAGQGIPMALQHTREGAIESGKLLLEAGVDANDGASAGTSPLALAIASNQTSFAAVLLERGADPNGTLAGYTALHAAAAGGQVELARKLLARGADPNARLASALPPGRFRGGGDANSAVSVRNTTPFWLAAGNLDPALMQLLLERGADPHLAAADGTTPLMAAAGLGQNDNTASWKAESALDAVRFLLRSGADVRAANKDGSTPLHGAAYMGADSVVRLLVDNGVGLDAITSGGRLLTAWRRGIEAVVRHLSNERARPNSFESWAPIRPWE